MPAPKRPPPAAGVAPAPKENAIVARVDDGDATGDRPQPAARSYDGHPWERAALWNFSKSQFLTLMSSG